ncbi:MAG: hypothetical protein JSS58_11225, partial [Proteobacteria bacterium]|nr:hypothetical protein [Pseudomonadota bacterium]
MMGIIEKEARKMQKLAFPIALSACLLAAGMAQAHGNATHRPTRDASEVMEEKAFGKRGDLASVDRNIAIEMLDSMRF